MIEQPNLPNFLQVEAEAREKGIPLEARQEYLSRMYWKFVRYQTKCRKDFDKNITRVEMIRGFIEKQR